MSEETLSRRMLLRGPVRLSESGGTGLGDTKLRDAFARRRLRRKPHAEPDSADSENLPEPQ